MLALINGIFYTGNGLINDSHMLVENDTIVGFVSKTSIPQNAEIIDLKGKNVAPGFIDLQVNGGCGLFFDPATIVQHVPNVSTHLARHGITRWFPTFLSLSKNKLLELKETIITIANEHGVLGVHLEGPWIDVEKRGVHSSKTTRFWDDEDLIIINQLSNHFLVCLTLSFSKIKPADLTKLVNVRGVKVLLGHTSASYEDASKFFSFGASGVTHIFNAMNQPTAREPGIVLAAMDTKKIFASVIADLFHVSAPVLRLLKRSFNEDSIFLVSDAMPVFGSKNDVFFIEGNKCTLDNGRITDQEGNLAGSAIAISDAIRNCVQSVGIPMDEALRMGTLYPARFLGLDNMYGFLAAGYKADITIFDNQLEVTKTYRDGRLIYES